MSLPWSSKPAVERAAFWALLAAVVVMPITKTLDLPLVGTRLTGFEVFAGVMILLWFSARLGTLGRSTFNLPGRAELGLAVLLLATALSGINVARLLDTPNAWNNFANELLTFVFLGAFLFAARDLASGPRFHRVLTAWFAGAAIVAVAGLTGWAEMIRCERPLSSLVIWDIRLLSTFRNPNQAAAYIVPTTAMLATMAVMARGGWSAKRLILFYALVVVLMGTGSKSGALAALATAAVLIVWLRATRRVLMVLAAAAVVVLAVAALTSVLAAGGNSCVSELSRAHQQLTFGLSEQLAVARSRPVPQWRDDTVVRPRGGAGAESEGAETATLPADAMGGGGLSSGHALGLRRALLGYASSMFTAHPVIGLGAGTMPLHVHQATGGRYYYATHNTVATLAAEVGVFGAAGFCWFFAALGWALVRRARLTQVPDERCLAVGLALAILSVLVMGLAMDAQRQRVLWVAAALAAATVSGAVQGTVTARGSSQSDRAG